ERGIDGNAIQVDRRTVGELRGDDSAEPLLSPNDERAPVARPGRVTMIVTVVGVAPNGAGEIHHEEIGTFIRVLVTLVQIRDERQRSRAGTPGAALDVDAG